MRIICFLFFTIVLFGTHKAAADLDDEKYEGVVDTKVMEYEENEEAEPERPIRKERIKGIKNFVGTNLFGETGSRKKCFSVEDVALLAARRDFESLIPKDLPNCLLDDELVSILMQYFYGANQIIEKMAGGHTKIFAQKAFYDTLGGYMKYYMIPISRYSFYAGQVKLRSVRNVLEIYTQCKYSLNTNGNGWKAPLADFSDLDIQIDPLRIIIRNEEEDVSCIQLEMADDHGGEEEDMIVALPRLDPEEKGVLGNIWLPFRRKRTFNLQSSMSAFVLLRYFELTTRCYTFQGICQDTFNKKFKEWILENLEIHFEDDVLYPGLGGILRIVETLRRKSKDSVIVVPKVKRQKTPNYTTLENTANELNKPLKDWPGSLFPIEEPDVVSDYIQETNLLEQKTRRMRYIYVGIGVTIVFLVIAFFLIMFALFKRWRKTRQLAEESKRKAEEGSWFWCKKSRKDDEEELNKSKSSSNKSKTASKSKEQTKSSKSEKPPKPMKSSKPVKSSKSGKSPKSSKSSTQAPKDSSSSSPEPPRCLLLCSKKNDPAIIETTSMDSDSGKDRKKKKKSQSPSPAKDKSKMTKTVTVNEKKRFYFSRRSQDSKEPEKGGIFKRKTK